MATTARSSVCSVAAHLAVSGGPNVEARALAACCDYDHWTREIARLTDEISAIECPKQKAEADAELERMENGEGGVFDGGRSHFAEARKMRTGNGWDGGARPLNLREVAGQVMVKNCAACSRLCAVIAERQHARNRLGVAKRAIRSVARRAQSSANNAEVSRHVSGEDHRDADHQSKVE